MVPCCTAFTGSSVTLPSRHCPKGGAKRTERLKVDGEDNGVSFWDGFYNMQHGGGGPSSGLQTKAVLF